MGKHYGLDIPTLRELRIDVDKEWLDETRQPRGITQLKELAAAMTKGDLGVRGNFVLVRLPPGPIGYKLTSAGPLKIPAWAPAGSALELWFPVWLDITHDERIFTPDYERLFSALMASSYPYATTPTKTPALVLEPVAGLYTPDEADEETIPVTACYQAEAHVANAFGHFSIGANNITIVNTIRGSRFVLCENATAQSISAYIQVTGVGPTVHVKAGIYDRNKDLVAEANQLSLAPGAAAWQTFPFTIPPSLAASEEYWPVVWGEDVADSGCIVFYDSGVCIEAVLGISLVRTYDTLPASIADGTPEARKLSIYCNYT